MLVSERIRIQDLILGFVYAVQSDFARFVEAKSIVMMVGIRLAVYDVNTTCAYVITRKNV